MKLIILLALFLTACCPCRHLAQKDSVSVVVKERVIRTTDTIKIEIPYEVEKIITEDTISVLKNNYAQSTAIVSRGKLTHELKTIQRKISHPIDVKTIERDSIVYKDKVQTIEVNVLTRWQKIKMEGFYILLSIFLLVFGFKASRLLK